MKSKLKKRIKNSKENSEKMDALRAKVTKQGGIVKQYKKDGESQEKIEEGK